MRLKLKARQRRAEIMEHSKGLFARLGLHGVSVNEIAEACKVSPAVLYQHFRSKEALYEEVINDLACEREDYVDAVLSGPSDFANVLYRMTVIFVKGRIRDADSVRIELRSLIDGDEIQEKFFSNHWKGLAEYIELSLQEMKETGTIESIDTRLAVLSYIALVRQVMITLSLDEQEMNGGAGVEYYVKGVLNIFLRGIELPALDW
ncbi:TetR/AcrR family transcriptional regulator [Thiobacillus sp.]